MKSAVIVIPSEGDSKESMRWYIGAIKNHLKVTLKLNRLEWPEIIVFKHDNSEEALKSGVAVSTQLSVHNFIEAHDFETAEIHAQGGLGAYVACEFLRQYEQRRSPDSLWKRITLTNVFLVGGAPCDAMTPVAKWFHRSFAKLWYRIQFAVPFFADDPPNPTCNDTITKIKDCSTRVMRENPELYRDQLVHIGNWQLAKDWQVPEGVKVWYVPNGVTLRNKLRDNTYDDGKAKSFWLEHGAMLTARPEGNFSFYSMMPAYELLSVMDKVR